MELIQVDLNLSGALLMALSRLPFKAFRPPLQRGGQRELQILARRLSAPERRELWAHGCSGYFSSAFVGTVSAASTGP